MLPHEEQEIFVDVMIKVSELNQYLFEENMDLLAQSFIVLGIGEKHKEVIKEKVCFVYLCLDIFFIFHYFNI